MLCPFCGTDIPDGSKFCAECGGKIATETAEQVSADTPDSETSEDIPFSHMKNEDITAIEKTEEKKAEKKFVLSKVQKIAVSLGSAVALLGIVFGVLLLTDAFGNGEQELEATQPPAQAQVITHAEEVELGSGSVDISGIMDSVQKDGFQAETPAGIVYESMSNLFADTSAFEFDVDIFCSEEFDGVSGQVVFGDTAENSLFHLKLEDTNPLELLIWDNSLYKKSTKGSVPSYMRVDFVYDAVFKAWENTYDPNNTQTSGDLEKCEFTLFSFVYGLFDGIVSTVMKGVLGLVLPNVTALAESLDDYFYVILNEDGTGSGVYNNLTTTTQENGLTTYTFDFGLSQFTSDTINYVEGEVPNGESYQYYGNAAELSYRAFMLALLNKDGVEYIGTYSPDVTVALTVGNSRLRVLEVSCQGQPIMKLTLNYEFTLDTNELAALVEACPAPVPSESTGETQAESTDE